MNTKISEHQEIRTVETLINEAKELGLRVVHRPDPIKTNVVSLDEHRVLSANTSPEVA
jgi:hypothetical protein